jgi:hypothetical protein
MPNDFTRMIDGTTMRRMVAGRRRFIKIADETISVGQRPDDVFGRTP